MPLRLARIVIAVSVVVRLGVGVGAVAGASNYSYFGGTPCDPGVYPGPYPLAGLAYAQGQPRQVQVIANISVTYAIQ
ncbi:MAG: hypothetical protein E6I03_08010 [Chloroflexi bacterium]|nr:MAG: hypothetical protein E6I03_08010 [Chloroflexota bacterium]